MTVNAPASHPSIVEVYNNQKQAGNAAPGYMVLDKYIYREFNENTKEDKNIKIEIVGSHSIIETSNKTEDYPPAYEFHGHYGQKEEKPRLEFHEQKGKSVIRKRKAHVALHFTGPDELRTLFEGNGFVVEDIYYLSNTGKSLPITEMTEGLLKKQPQILCILARKPQGN